jgi:hypothetical protein
MKLHANAALSLKGRRELCRRVLEGERTLSEAADRRRTVTLPPSLHRQAGLPRGCSAMHLTPRTELPGRPHP